MQWRISEVKANDGLIVSAKYHVVCEQDGFKADTEGYWHFVDPSGKIAFEEVTEAVVSSWIKNESKGMIEARLQEQIDALKAEKSVKLPWMMNVFTLGEQK